MGNIRSIREFREAQDDDFWDVGVGSEADWSVRCHKGITSRPIPEKRFPAEFHSGPCS